MVAVPTHEIIEHQATPVKGRTTEEVLREIVTEGHADPRIVALVARFDARAAKRAAKEEAADDDA